MAIDKITGNGWRSRFSKKIGANDGGVGLLADPFQEQKQRSMRPSKGGGKMSALLGLDDELKIATIHNSQQYHRAANDSNVGVAIDFYNIKPSVASSLSPHRSYLHDFSLASRVIPIPELLSGESSRSTSQGSSTKSALNSIDVEETSCPVCLELLSFRLVGEKPHVTPACGHALHHACFTAVYGFPEVIMAAQSTPGRSASPGMCGVCRASISLGDESDIRRQNSEFSFEF